MSDERLAKLQGAGFVFRCRAPRKLPAGGSEQPESPGVSQSVVQLAGGSNPQSASQQPMDQQGQELPQPPHIMQHHMGDHSGMDHGHEQLHAFHV
jgi:hypothetical protein